MAVTCYIIPDAGGQSSPPLERVAITCYIIPDAGGHGGGGDRVEWMSAYLCIYLFYLFCLKNICCSKIIHAFMNVLEHSTPNPYPIFLCLSMPGCIYHIHVTMMYTMLQEAYDDKTASDASVFACGTRY